MSEGPIHRERKSTTVDPIPTFRPGTLVTPEQHPTGCDVWRVESQDGSVVTLTATTHTSPSRIRRDARAVTRTTKEKNR